MMKQELTTVNVAKTVKIENKLIIFNMPEIQMKKKS